MGQHTTLTELRESYLLGKIDRKRFEGSIFQYLLNNYERYHLFRGSREDWDDLLIDVYPRISRAVEAYQDKGASFDSYISALIHWAYKERRNRETSHQVTEYTWWRAHAEELSAGAPETEYSFESPDNPNPPQKCPHAAEISSVLPAMDESFTPESGLPEQILSLKKSLSRQQILILFLKSYYFITEDIVLKVSGALGVEKEELWGMVEKLRSARKKREEEIREIEAGIECQYYRCLAYQKRLHYAAQGSADQKRLHTLLERARLRSKRMRKRLNGIRFDATNGQIAKILNIPKGTVDSSLHSIRKKSKGSGFVWEKPLYSKRQGL